MQKNKTAPLRKKKTGTLNKTLDNEFIVCYTALEREVIRNDRA